MPLVNEFLLQGWPPEDGPRALTGPAAPPDGKAPEGAAPGAESVACPRKDEDAAAPDGAGRPSHAGPG
jgi:hypothetical protein